MTAALDVAAIRAQFPALVLKDGGRDRIYFDNPAGTQVPQRVIDRTVDCLANRNANLGGYFTTTVEAGELVDLAHQACADFYNAAPRAGFDRAKVRWPGGRRRRASASLPYPPPSTG